MKRVFSILVAFIIICMSVLSVCAEVTHDNNKESRQSYAGQGKLKCTEETVLDFDDMSQFFHTWKGKMDETDKKQGTASLAVDLSTEEYPAVFKPNCFETKDGSFKTTVNDFRKETFKLWVYVNDIDKLVCDHDSVHPVAQKGSGTIYITLADSSYQNNQFFVQHTIEGSGWHLIEFDLTVSREFVKYYGEKNIEIGYLKIYVEALEGLEMKFDDLKKVTYSNDGYTAPSLEKNGRWLSTCDYDAIDGAIVTEWYGSSFDTSEKSQGSSSLSIRGRKIHEDYRVVWSGMDVECDRNRDILHFDMYIEDMDVLGSAFEQRMRLADTSLKCDCECWLYYSYDHLRSYSNDRTGLKNGWNSIDIPLISMTNGQEKSDECKAADHKWNIVFNLMYWPGAYSDKYYVVKYDNMYVYEGDGYIIPQGSQGSGSLSFTDEKVADYAKQIAEKTLTKTPNCSEQDLEKIKQKLKDSYPNLTVTFNEDGTITVEEKSNLMLYAVIGIAAAAVIILVVIIIVVVSKKKKNKPKVQNNE